MRQRRCWVPSPRRTPSPWRPRSSRGTESRPTALRLRQLDGVKRVLMIAAHPDDEDTSLLAALARGAGAETAYLSLSRGEGGQNLIGPRLHEGLGIVRTGELLAARALDGGEQFFARTFDFGYSKSLDEAVAHWPMDEVVRDVVFVVRQFRPHVIVTVFSGTRRDGHGQHQIAGLAAREAFEAAGDPSRFPELASQGVEPWAPAKLYRSVRFSPDDATVRVATGQFRPRLGALPLPTGHGEPEPAPIPGHGRGPVHGRLGQSAGAAGVSAGGRGRRPPPRRRRHLCGRGHDLGGAVAGPGAGVVGGRSAGSVGGVSGRGRGGAAGVGRLFQRRCGGAVAAGRGGSWAKSSRAPRPEPLAAS